MYRHLFKLICLLTTIFSLKTTVKAQVTITNQIVNTTVQDSLADFSANEISHQAIPENVIQPNGTLFLIPQDLQLKTYQTTPVPVDFIKSKTFIHNSQATIEQILNYSAPSFNSSNQAVSGAASHFDVSELRNLGASRTLVLINGKRKNPSALVYLNNTLGKGEVGTDLKNIPLTAIERIEILRDGAGAILGSDAIGGAINIVLKDYYPTALNIGTGTTTAGDGLTYNADFSKSFIIKDLVQINTTLSYHHQDYTNRTNEESGDLFFGTLLNDNTISNGTHSWLVDNPDKKMIIGQPEYDKFSAITNFSLPYSNDDGEIYASYNFTKRYGASFGFYRTPYWIADDYGLLTPEGEDYNGFQPTFETNINDYHATIGNIYSFKQWQTDVSLTTGGNNFSQTIGNTINTSLGSNSPTQFNGGTYDFSHIVGNVDLSREIANRMTLIIGMQTRHEKFAIEAGQEEAYINDGAEAFSGPQSSDTISATRNNTGIYTAFDIDIMETLVAGIAFRYENYTQFGNNFSWRFQTRQSFLDEKGAVRASASTGFRPPSLHQIYASNLQTSFSNGVIGKQATLNHNNNVLQELGIPSLNAETNFNISTGISYRLNQLFIGLDYYNITINNRILLTNHLGFDDDDNTINPVEQTLIDNSVSDINFFLNAADTRTQGIDLVLTYDNLKLFENFINISLAGNFNRTKIKRIAAPNILTLEGYEVFNRQEQSRITTARPNSKVILAIDYQFNKFNINLNNAYFGKVTWQHATDPTKDQTFRGKVITDLTVAFSPSRKFSLSVVINNLFNVYPDTIETDGDFITDMGGRFRYPWEVNQFGFNGMVLKFGASYRFDY